MRLPEAPHLLAVFDRAEKERGQDIGPAFFGVKLVL